MQDALRIQKESEMLLPLLEARSSACTTSQSFMASCQSALAYANIHDVQRLACQQ